MERQGCRFVNNSSSAGQSFAELRKASTQHTARTLTHRGLDTHHARLIVHLATTMVVALHEAHEASSREATPPLFRPR
jgi:Abortive infection C-terminus